MKPLIVTFLCKYFYLLGVISLLTGCRTEEEKALKRGEELAKIHCSGCHSLPDPALLDKKTWRDGVLPAMATQFGIEVLEGNFYWHDKNSKLSDTAWLNIVRYYKSLAPDSLAQPQRPPVLNDWSIFRLKKPSADSSQISGTLMIAINPEENRIYSSGLNNPGLYRWDGNLKSRLLTTLKSPAVDITFANQPDSVKNVITCMGGMRALDETKGDIMALSQNNDQNFTKTKIETGFIRPIQSRPIDFNKDGLTDYVVCSFGHNKGGLYLMERLPDKSFRKLPIREMPGATQAVTGDFNHDGWPDIVALFAHGDEGIWLFINNKKGGFETQNILRFPSVFGSSSFQLVDMNKDGKLDIIYTAGDNSDYSRVLKPFHGIYIFTNRGDFSDASLRFEKTYFYPINGCTKAIATDFDQDGDMDIATIAFFADLDKNPSEKFIYFENIPADASQLFRPHAIPIQKNGRWICMDVNDFDGDGDKDIVLGNFSRGFLNQDNFKRNWDLYTPFVILENGTR